ncbi:uncharacterized protein (TIGR02001 family) [Luteimonas cucumeris]|uniref:Uncharacterized protein (TIGR02001 family) n=1 Tax=Luteimonas cucumeris TaxID=985012 RepID=A0A562L2J8_9GAMM|nr:TorF family putative porin [Luteimonas cucumeris]TWI01890.1 uncharacterized protein (TIGR02001 family) [Luteimonas cucumeris]
MSHLTANTRAIGALPAALAAVFTGVAALGASGVAQAVEVVGNATLTTDYVWRGSTQTQGDPAVQAGFKVAGESGFYGSIWASNVEFAPETHASSEFDFTLGWGCSLDDDWALDVNVLHYRYPSTTIELNWTELNGTATWKDNYWASLGYSDEALGYDESGIHALLGARFPVNDKMRFEAAIAYYDLKDLNGDDSDDGYAHGLLSAVWAFKTPGLQANMEARLTAHATDSSAEDFFGEAFAGNRIEAALQASF